MAAITSAVIGATSLGMSAYQAIDGANRSKKAQRELNDYERQELNNAYEDVKISTMGSDLLREENARTTSNLVDASRMGGARTVIGGIPRIVSSTTDINREAAKMLDDQVRQREYSIAGDNARIEGITENRDNANISALSSQVEAGRQDMWSGFGSALSSAAYMGRGLKETKGTNTGEGFKAPNIDTSKGIGWENKTPYFKTSNPLSSVGNTTDDVLFQKEYSDLINKYNRKPYF